MTIGGVVKVSTINTTPVHVEVEAVQPHGYLLAWTAGETHFDAAAAASLNPLMKKMTRVMAGRKLLLRIDRHGRLLEVMNWQAVRLVGNSMAIEIAEMLAQSGVSPTQAAPTVDKFRSMFSSEDQVRQIATREAQLLLQMLGHAYDQTHATDFAETVPNPTGDGEISAIEHVDLQNLAGNAILDWMQRPAPRGGDASSASASVKVGPRSTSPTGWPRLVTQSVSATVDDAQRTETTSLKRQ